MIDLLHNQSPEPTAVGAFRLTTTNGFTTPQVGGDSAFVR